MSFRYSGTSVENGFLVITFLNCDSSVSLFGGIPMKSHIIWFSWVSLIIVISLVWSSLYLWD